MDLLQFTSNQLKEVISKQMPELKGYKKKRKELLIYIIKTNELDTTELDAFIKIKQPDVKLNISTLVSFGN
jgi:hypothetical protein